MKTPLVTEADRRASLAAADLNLQINALFVACPNLCGFVIEERTDIHGDVDLRDTRESFVITEVSFGAPLSHDESDEICALVASAISDLIAAQPEASTLLRGRTFARTLH